MKSEGKTDDPAAPVRSVILRIRVSWQVFKMALSSFFEHGCLNMAAALAFFAILSSIPFLLILISLTGKVLGSAEVYKVVQDFVSRLFPASSLSFLDQLKNVGSIGRFLGGMGAITFISMATVAFRSLEFAMNVVFRVEKRRRKDMSLLMSLATIPMAGVFLLLSFLITYATTFIKTRSFLFYDMDLSKLWNNYITINYIVPFLMMTLLFTVIYKLVPNRKIPLRHALLGGALCSFLWELAKHLFTIYVDRFANVGDLYGHFGTVVILILWIFYSSSILLFCAEVIASYLRKDLIFLARVLTEAANKES